jgi:hypothetical protein
MRVFFIFLLFFSFVFAKSDKISHIPPVKNVIVNLGTDSCGLECMQKLLEDGKIFSFLGYYNASLDELELMHSEFEYYKKIFRIFEAQKMSIRVALLIPQKSIRRYAVTTVNSVLAYLMSKPNNFELKVFNSINEDENSLLEEISKIKDDGFTYVIAPLTDIGAKIVTKNSQGLVIYIPTVHKSKVDYELPNVIFGGIDYEKQIEELLRYTNEKVAYFGDGSSLSNSLNTILLDKTDNIVYGKNISSSRVSFKRIMKKNKKLQESSIFMNTPLVKTSLIASQLRYYELEPYALLSTQINYNPMLLTLTQYEDRKNFYIANSIGKSTVSMKEFNSLFGHDIVYDWVNYATSIGIDYFYTRFFIPVSSSAFKEIVKDRQVQYDVSIIQPKRYSFKKVLF